MTHACGTMLPRTLDERIVILDVDEKAWLKGLSRNRMAGLVDEPIDRQKWLYSVPTSCLLRRMKAWRDRPSWQRELAQAVVDRSPT
jgi:hypothetical protein